MITLFSPEDAKKICLANYEKYKDHEENTTMFIMIPRLKVATSNKFILFISYTCYVNTLPAWRAYVMVGNVFSSSGNCNNYEDAFQAGIDCANKVINWYTEENCLHILYGK